MSEISWEHASEAREALQAIVSDPEHGAAALSSPQTMSNLLKDLLPDAPREKSILVAAAEAGLADSLRDHMSQGANPDMAVRLTASSFAATTPYPPDACDWVTDEIAIALGMQLGGRASGPGAAAGGFDPPGRQWMPTQAAQGAVQDAGFGVPGYSDPGGASGQAAQGSWPGAGQGFPQAPPPQAPPATAAAAGQGFPQAPPVTAAPGFGQAEPPTPLMQGYGQAAPPTFPPAPGYQVPMPGAMSAGQGFAPVPGSGYPAPDPRFAPGLSGYRAPRNNSLAIAALICGVVQFLAWFVFLVPGLIAAVLAVVFGLVSMKQIRRTGESGRGLAVTGVILGGLGVLGGIVVVVLAVIGLHAQN
jgi:hypothetical protein